MHFVGTRAVANQFGYCQCNRQNSRRKKRRAAHEANYLIAYTIAYNEKSVAEGSCEEQASAVGYAPRCTS